MHLDEFLIRREKSCRFTKFYRLLEMEIFCESKAKNYFSNCRCLSVSVQALEEVVHGELQEWIEDFLEKQYIGDDKNQEGEGEVGEVGLENFKIEGEDLNPGLCVLRDSTFAL